MGIVYIVIVCCFDCFFCIMTQHTHTAPIKSCHNYQSLGHICVVEVSDIKWKRPGLKLNSLGSAHSMGAPKSPGDCSACGHHRLFASMDDWQEDSKA